jgi:uncharacterized membrane protein YeaQ/YmgE (transglycosylase-associated protein family)
MGFFAWIFVGLIAGGLVFGSLLGFSYNEGFNLATIASATGGAVILLWIVGALRSRRPIP